MRVAVITRYFPTSQEPWAGHSAYQTLRFLTKHCELKVFYPESQYPKFLTPRSRAGRSLDFNHRISDVAVQYIPYPALPAVSRPLNGWAAARSILSDVRRFRPDIILNYIVYPDGFAALRVGKALGVPVVVIAIGSDLNRIPDPFCGALTRQVLRRTDFLITVSGDLRRTALKMGADVTRSKAVLNGCDTSIFYPRDTREARRLLRIDEDGEAIVYVGRLDVAKGLRELIEAMARLRVERPRAHCYIVGDGHDKSILVEAIARQGVGEAVTLVPSCPTDQVALWMAAADLVTLPSYREGCPNVVIEALASGRPVVASDVGGIPELMDDSSGRLVPANDASALTIALGEVLSQQWDPAEISGRHSRSWSDVSYDVQKILEQVLSSRS
ncbi:MAG: glycosyl transferase, group 1 family protein [Edaphobacter sp.]|nr:glycosyl transferase, group 1 family protein [Edaphobacter sp.]